ncbi:MAG: hypothetical protein GC161_14985 [Planctomycetaceae bacterium]|nr:hypothetical protein [Planctomycetaceae bacterium]
MERLWKRTGLLGLVAAALPFVASAMGPGPAAGDYWIEAAVKARSLWIDPATGELHEVMDADAPMGLVSPDGKRIVYLGSDPERVRAGHDFDLFAADVDPNSPSGKAASRRITDGQVRPHAPVWLPGSDGIAFLAMGEAEARPREIWLAPLAPDAEPRRIETGDALGVSQLSVTPDGSLAFVALRSREGKVGRSDLVIADAAGKVRSVPVRGQFVGNYAFRPDGSQLAWGGLGAVFVEDLVQGTTREIPLAAIHRKLANHTVHEMAWRPDGEALALYCGFLGGVAAGSNRDPNAPPVRMFAEDKIFVLPLGFAPAPTESTEGGFPSPLADDPASEQPDPVGDGTRPHWIRGLPMAPIELKWIDGARARARFGADR